MSQAQILAVVKTYLRAAAAAVLALYLAMPDQPLKSYLAAGLAAVAGPLLKALDKGDKAFGLGSTK